MRLTMIGLRKTSIIQRYSAIFCCVLFLLVAGIVVLMFRFTSDRLVNDELKNAQTNLQQAVTDMEKQHEVMQDIAHQIRATSSYRPGILKQSAYKDIELLTDFVRFGNYSPLISQYFLIYQNSDKVYTWEGKISYYQFFARSVLNCTKIEADDLFQLLNSLQEEQIVQHGRQVFIMMPLRFVNTITDQENAALCFIMQQQDFANRMAFIAARPLEDLSLRLGKTTVLGAGEEVSTPLVQNHDNRFLLTAVSESGFVNAECQVLLERWPLLFSAVPAWLYTGIIMLMLLVALTGVLFGRLLVKPLRNVIRRYVSPTDYIQNEFDELNRLVSRMEEENSNSMQLIKERTLLTILHGYYNKRLIERWGFLQLQFDFPLYCVGVIHEQEQYPVTDTGLVRSIEKLMLPGTVVYACRASSDEVIALIIGYHDLNQRENVLHAAQAMLHGESELFVGRECSSPERLSTSYVDALSQFHHSQGRVVEDIQHFIRRIVAAAEDNDTNSITAECQSMAAQYSYPSAQMVKQFAINASTALNMVANEKHITLDRNDVNNLVLLADMNSCLSDIAEIVRKAFQQERKPVNARTEQQATAIIAYIREHAYDPDFDLSTISAHFNLSNDYISASVKAAVGVPFKEYQTSLRMQKASRMLLEQPDKTVTEVSEAVGYRKASNFIKKFKETYGVTPSQYR